MALAQLTLFLAFLNIFHLHGKQLLVNVKEGPESSEDVQRLGSNFEAGDYFSDYSFGRLKIPRKRCIWSWRRKRRICYRKKRTYKVDQLKGLDKKKLSETGRSANEVAEKDFLTLNTEKLFLTTTTENFLSQMKWTGGMFRRFIWRK